MKPYKPSNKVSLIGIPLLLFAVFGGVLIGGLVSILSRVIYLVFIFPIAIGVAGGFMLTRTVLVGKVRSPVLAGVVGVLIGIAIYASMHYFNYLWFRSQATVVLQPGASNTDLTESIVDAMLVRETGLAGFWGYLAFIVREGVSIGRVFGGLRFNLGPVLTLVYRLVELVVIAGISAIAGIGVARQPFSEKRNEWYPTAKYLGAINANRAEEFLHLVQISDFARIGDLFGVDAPAPNICLYLQYFNWTQEESILSASMVSQNESKEILLGLISPTQASALIQGISHRVNPSQGDSAVARINSI